MNRSVRMLGAALSASLLALGLASPVFADTITLVGNASGQASTATTVCEFNSQTNTFTFTITNTSAITQPGSTSTITAIGFDLPPDGNASASGLNGFTGMQAPSLSSTFVFSDAAVGAVPGFATAVLDFAFLTGPSGTFADGSVNDGLLPGESASFTISGASFAGSTEAGICNAIFVHFENVPTVGTDVGVPPPAATLTIVKVTDPATDPQDFDFDLTGAGVPTDLDLDTDPGSAGTPSEATFELSVNELGAHTVTESAVDGWSLTGLDCTGAGADSSTNLDTRVATLDIDQGEVIECTYTNTRHATLTVVKETEPASDPQDFDFDLTGAGVPADVDLDTDPGSAGTPSEESFTLSAGQLGAHAVSESAVPGWALIALECTGAGDDSTTNLETRTATLDIDAGETVVCTFTNTSVATLTIRKVTDPASDQQDFDFDLTGSGVPADLDLDTDAASAGTPSETTFEVSGADLGAHTVSESPTAGWSLTALACTGAGDDSLTNVALRTAILDLDAGEVVVCTFTNTKAPVVQPSSSVLPSASVPASQGVGSGSAAPTLPPTSTDASGRVNESRLAPIVLVLALAVAASLLAARRRHGERA